MILLRDKNDEDLVDRQLPHQRSLSSRILDLMHEDPEDDECAEDPQELRDLISIVNTKHSVAEQSRTAASSSRGESHIVDLIASGQRTVIHTQRHLLRTYPAGKRLDSSNYDPFLAWGVGAQIVAMNWQTAGVPMWVYAGMFRDNGGCGYVKKPNWLLANAKPQGEEENGKLLRLKLLSARHMRYRAIRENSVTLEMFGVGKDCKAFTSTIKKGYDCCTWDQEFLFPLVHADCAVLLMTLRTGEKFAGQTAIPINNLSQGKFQMHLMSKKGHRYTGTRRHIQLVFEISLQPITGNLKKMFL
jgi:phosphatidylinositol phospholipase C delta